MDIFSILVPALIIGGLGLLFGIGLTFAYKFLKVEDDPVTAAIREALPGANCGACAFTGCDLFAEAVANRTANPSACTVGGAKTIEDLSSILGIEPEHTTRKVAYIKCAGNFNAVKFKYKYSGMVSCDAAAQLIGDGERACPYGCLGYRTCEEACIFDAIKMVDGVSVVDKDKCTACGLCIKSCPKNLIEMQPYAGSAAVACNSVHSGRQVRGYCSVGCIACNLCVKKCESDAIKIENHLAIIDADKCIGCNKCVGVCPMKTITSAYDGSSFMGKKIVVLGAGYAGLLIAKKLDKKLKAANAKAEVTIIDKNPFFTMLTELHEVAAGRISEDNIRIDLKKVFANSSVNVVQDTITDTDYENNTITGQYGTYQYDYLVMATGCKPAFFGVEGAKEHSYPLWSYDNAVDLRDHILDMFSKAYREPDPARKKELLTFYVVGGGFTGVEMAGELAELVPFVCEKFKIDPELVTIVLVDFLDRVMAYMPEKLSTKAAKRLEKMGVSLLFNAKVVRVSDNEIAVEKDGKTTTHPAKTIIWAAGTEGSDIAKQSEDLGLAERSGGRVQTDEYLRSLTHPNVYIAGDNIYYIPKDAKEPVPQMVENCEACAPVIAANIISEVEGNEPGIEYAPKFHGEMVCIGGRYGLAHIGLPDKKIALPSILAMFMKHFINIILFVQVLGWNKTYSYLMAEFFTIRNKRSFVGGHFSNRSPTFLIMPLRVFLGIYFIYDAYIRFAFGWLQEPRLRDVFYDVAGQFRPVMENIEITLFDRIRFSMVVNGGEMTMWLQTSAVNWFFSNVIFASGSMEMFAQRVIVIFLMLLGLAFISGLFTSLASVGALGVTLLIIITVGLPFSIWWVPFAAIAMLFTGGRALSLDYYVMPWLAKHWKNIKFVKKWHIYND